MSTKLYDDGLDLQVTQYAGKREDGSVGPCFSIVKGDGMVNLTPFQAMLVFMTLNQHGDFKRECIKKGIA
jgi:hypothetical protein